MNGIELPVIRRTREYHVYDEHGRRYLDLCLDGGRALLGHKPGRTVLAMKNSLEKGLSASYPNIYAARLKKAVKGLYPGISGFSLLSAGAQENSLPVKRPFDGNDLPADGIFELRLPLPGSSLVRLVCGCGASAGNLPPTEPVPGFVLSGLCRAAADLAAFREKADASVWSAFDSELWTRKGPWLYPAVPEDEYARLFTLLAERGILISPDFREPSCAPYAFTEGEIKPIKQVEGEFFGNDS